MAGMSDIYQISFKDGKGLVAFLLSSVDMVRVMPERCLELIINGAHESVNTNHDEAMVIAKDIIRLIDEADGISPPKEST